MVLQPITVKVLKTTNNNVMMFNVLPLNQLFLKISTKKLLRTFLHTPLLLTQNTTTKKKHIKFL